MGNWRQNLTEGYQSFRAGNYAVQKTRYEKLANTGQNPDVMVIACADSRAMPSTIFNAAPGEIFTVRNVANLVPPCEETQGYHGVSSALEYAVKELKVKAILIMGHEKCGGVATFLKNRKRRGRKSFIDQWIHILDKAKPHAMEKAQHMFCENQEWEMAGVRLSIEHLRSFPFVRKAVQAGRLELVGAYFQISDGQLFLQDEEGVFQPVPR